MVSVHSNQQIANLRPWWWFLFLAAVSLMIGGHTLLILLALAGRNDAYTHILLIVPIVAGLIYLEWPTARLTVAPSWRAGSIFLLSAAIVAVLAKWGTSSLGSDVQLSISTLAIVLWWIGAFVACFGTRTSRSLLFPLCFLLCLVPLPTFLLDAIVGFLQRGSADAAQLLFNAVGVPVVQDGIRLSIPGLTVEVAQECSSIRSSLILLVSTMVLAQLFLRSPWRKAFVIAVVVPLSLAKNGLRIFTIAMLGTRVDPGFLNGKLHHNGGVIFLAIALLVIFLLLWILRDEKSRPSETTLRPAVSTVRK
jgi:exosortase